jgi:alkyl sulfatase BDS1-like metallo-beta-lactamase superfamily hydrolase
VVGHENVAARLDRYDLTRGYNAIINHRQFGARGRVGMSAEEPFWPTGLVRPDTTFDHRLGLNVGGLSIELRHGRGETDDHAWAWVPERRAILAGDFVIWVFPNAGNPQKVQRYPLDWAKALREMAALRPELLLPAHGLPVAGEERIATMLDDMATALEGLVRDTLALMNAGAALDDIVHSVRVPEHLLAKPYLQPTYDEPDFVVRNIWRLYGGWYDGNPSRLKPPPDAAIATEVATLAGGADRLAARAEELVATDPQLAASLVELAARAAPDDAGVHRVRADVYRACRGRASSLMAKGIYGWAADESGAKAPE